MQRVLIFVEIRKYKESELESCFNNFFTASKKKKKKKLQASLQVRLENKMVYKDRFTFL